MAAMLGRGDRCRARRGMAASGGAERLAAAGLAGSTARRPAAAPDPSCPRHRPRCPQPSPHRVRGRPQARAQDGRTRAFAVEHQGERLGSLRVTSSPREPLTPAGERLVHDVAAQAGLVLRNVGLIEDLRASRQRLVTAADEARRGLERDLHDGAQQQLVALRITLGLARQVLRDSPDEAAEPARPDRAPGRGGTGGAAGTRPRDLPAAAGRPGAARRARGAGGKAALPVTVEADGAAGIRRTSRRRCTSASWRRCRTSRSTRRHRRPA